MNISKALQTLRPGAQWVVRGEKYSGIEWLDKKQSQPTESEINNEIARLAAQRPFDICKEKAKELIAASDWAALPDVGLKNAAEFVTYRGILRGLIITPVADPVWPTEPTPIWE